MDVAPQVAGLATHDQADFRVGFQALHAINDLRSGALEFVRAVQIARLVKAGLELDECGDVLTIFRRLDECIDDP